MESLGLPAVDDRSPAITFRTLNYGNYGTFLIMGHAGFISSTVRLPRPRGLSTSPLGISKTCEAQSLGFRV